MLVIIKDGAVYFAESLPCSDQMLTENDFINYEENRHIMRDPYNPHNLIGVFASARDADVIRYEDIFPKRLTPEYLMKNTYPKILSCLKPYGLEGKERENIDYVFAKKDKCYRMRYEGCLDLVEEFVPYTANTHVAIGSYLKNKDKPIYDLIRCIYKDLESLTKTVHFPAVVINTKNSETKIIYSEEEC